MLILLRNLKRCDLWFAISQVVLIAVLLFNCLSFFSYSKMQVHFITNKIKHFETKMDSVSNTINNIKSTLNKARNEFQQLKAELFTIEKEVVGINEKLATITSQLANFTNLTGNIEAHYKLEI